MKKLIIVCLAFTTVLAACGQKEKKAPAKTVEKTEAAAAKANKKPKAKSANASNNPKVAQIRAERDAYWSDVKSGLGVSDDVITQLQAAEKERKQQLKDAKDQKARQAVNKANRHSVRKILGGEKYQKYIALTRDLKAKARASK